MIFRSSTSYWITKSSQAIRWILLKNISMHETQKFNKKKHYIYVLTLNSISKRKGSVIKS